MPGVTSPHDDYFVNLIADMQRRLDALERQQNFGIRDASGLIRVQGGQQSDGTYGLRAFDSSGNARAVFGSLASGDYGFAVTDVLGNTSELNPFISNQVGAAENTTSTTPVDLATVGPSVTCQVGASGKVLVIASAYCATPASDRAKAYLFIDGSDIGGAYSPFVEAVIGAGPNLAGTFAQIGIFSVTANAQHTFKLKYSSQNGGSVQFATRDLIVQPQ